MFIYLDCKTCRGALSFNNCWEPEFATNLNCIHFFHFRTISVTSWCAQLKYSKPLLAFPPRSWKDEKINPVENWEGRGISSAQLGAGSLGVKTPVRFSKWTKVSSIVVASLLIKGVFLTWKRRDPSVKRYQKISLVLHVWIWKTVFKGLKKFSFALFH